MLFIFDMGGVCCNTWKGTDRICQVLGITKEDFARFSGKNTEKDLFAACTKGTIDTKTFWEEFNRNSGMDVNTDWFHFLFHPVMNGKTLKIIENLKVTGHRVVCGTNTISGHYQNHIENGDYAFFDQTYASCLMGVAKPDPEFYRMILLAEETEAADTVFIDDRIENVESAAGAGIKAIHFKSPEELQTEIDRITG